MAKKKPTFQVNEDKLKMMMAGDIPMKLEPGDLTIIGEEENQADEILQPEKKDIAEAVSEKRISGDDKAGKKKKNDKDKDKYRDLFLSKPPERQRRQRTLLFDDALYSMIFRLVNVPGGISFSNFICNLVNHHFEIYKDEINEILRSIANDIYKSE